MLRISWAFALLAEEANLPEHFLDRQRETASGDKRASSICSTGAARIV